MRWLYIFGFFLKPNYINQVRNESDTIESLILKPVLEGFCQCQHHKSMLYPTGLINHLIHSPTNCLWSNYYQQKWTTQGPWQFLLSSQSANKYPQNENQKTGGYF